MNLYYSLALMVLVSVSIIALILINRAKYKKAILKLKLQEYSNRLKIGETYWYNSSKGLLNDNHPSCWAKVVAEPVLDKHNVVIVEVILKIGNKSSIATFVPANSLAKIDQLNS
jgi:hypothetical protein